MSNRYLLLLPLVVAASLIACGKSAKGSGAALQKTFGTGGRQGLDHSLGSKGCLNLVEVAKTIAAESDGAAIHSRDYDLGQIAPVNARLMSFKTATDAATVQLLDHRALSGQNAPVYVSTASGAELLETKPAADLLGVESQTACQSVKFKSGAEFQVKLADAQTLRLFNPQTNETREYIHQIDNIVVNVFAPVTLAACDGKPSPAKTERISSRITWGASVGSVKLADAYAKRLGLQSSQISYLKFQSNLKTLASRAESLNCQAN